MLYVSVCVWLHAYHNAKLSNFFILFFLICHHVGPALSLLVREDNTALCVNNAQISGLSTHTHTHHWASSIRHCKTPCKNGILKRFCRACMQPLALIFRTLYTTRTLGLPIFLAIPIRQHLFFFFF